MPTPRPRRTVLVLLGLLWVAAPAAAQWTDIGDMPAPTRRENTLLYRNERATVAVTAVAPGIVRVRMAPGRELGRDHSYAVVQQDFGDPGARFDIRRDVATIDTDALKVTVRHRPFRVAFADQAGNTLDQDDPAMGTAISGRKVRVHKRLRQDEMVYGLGEKTGRLNKRGWWLGGYSYTMWNTDAGGYDPGTDPLYASFPVYIVMREGRAHGVFLDNTFRSNFDIGKAWQDILSIGIDGGELDYYFIDGPDPKQVIARYTELTGRMPLPPLWSLGFHQCRYSYYPESRVRFIADNFRQRRIPADVIWLDIHYLEGYNPLTWDEERFPDPAGMIGDLRAQGFRLVTIIDPHPKKEPGWDVYDTGLAGNHFATLPDGRVYEAPVWPSNAEVDPAPSVFPDYSRPATREWWGGLYKRLTDVGVAGIWNDMNEPAVFVAPTWTMALDVRFDNEGQPTDTREIKNVYGQLMTRSTYEGLLKLRPDERPFVLTRATFSGGQRYSALWPGDNLSRWEDLRQSLPMLMNLGLSGMSFVGSDIGGFGESPPAELVTRWLQTGVFYPFMRMHTTIGTADQEPWSYGVMYEGYNRRAIELRYELLPHVYNEMERASATGIPPLRPLFLEYPADPATYSLDDQFMFGRDLLVAPVLFEGHRERELYLPKGTWYDYWTGQAFEGGRRVTVPVTLASIPIFVRDGGFVFRQPVVQHTGEMPGEALRIAVYPGTGTEATLYEDDGASFAFRNGAFLRRTFRQTRDASGAVTVEVGAPEGSYRPETRSLELHVFPGAARVRTVRVGGSGAAGTDIPRFDPKGGAESASGWAVGTDGAIVVRVPDRFEAFSVRLEP